MKASLAETNFLRYVGDTWKNCGASGGQEEALASDQAFQKMLTSDYGQTFAENSALFNNLSTNLSQITGAGPGQQGYTAPELAAMNSQAINAAAASNEKLQTSIGEEGAKNTASPGVESGVQQAEKAAAQTQVDTGLNNTEANITQKNYDTGRQNYWDATKTLEALPRATENPESEAANAVTGSNNATSNQADQNAAANNAWIGLVGGLAGDAATAYAGK